MSRKFLVNIDLAGNQLLNALLHIVAGDVGSPSNGQVWYNSTTHKFRGRANGATVTFVNDGGDLTNGSVALAKLATDPLARANHTGSQTASTISDFDTQVRTSRLDQMTAPTAAVSFNSQRITGVATPTAGTDAANKNYVDDAVAGLAWKDSVRAATTATGTLASSFANGQTVDGVTLVTGDRILLKNQSAGAENGIYIVAASGAPTRASDFDATAEVRGAAVMVEEGTTNANTQWVMTTDNVTVGTTAQTWSQFGGGATYTAGDGLTLSTNTFNVGAGTGITVGADTVGIDTAVVNRKYAASIGDGSTTAIAHTHSLGTRDIIWQVYDNSTFETVECDVVRTSTTVTTFTFAVAPTSNQYRIVGTY